MDGPWWNHYWLSSCRTCLFCSSLAGTVLLSLKYWFISQILQPASSELLCRVSGLPWFTFQWEKQEMVVQSVPGLRLGRVCFESVRKASDPIASRAEFGEEWVESSWKKQWDLENWFYCVKRTQSHVLDREKSIRRTSEDRGTMANKRVYRDQGWLYILRETTDTEDRGRDFHCPKPDKPDTSSEQERMSQGLKEGNVLRLFSF